MIHYNEFDINELNVIIDSSKMSKALLKYITHLVNMRPSNFEKLKIVFNSKNLELDFKIIERIVGLFNNSVAYSIKSSKGLSEHMVKFINDNNINYILVYNGANQPTDILKCQDFVELFARLKYKSILSTISNTNQDLYLSLWNHIDKIIPGIIILESSILCLNDASNIDSINITEFKEMLKTIEEVAYIDMQTRNFNSRELSFLYPYIDLVKASSHGDYRTQCSQFKSNISVNLAGLVYPCYNFTNKSMARVSDEYSDILEKYNTILPKIDSKRTECGYSLICKGGCPYNGATKYSKTYCAIIKSVIDTTISFIKRFEVEYEQVDFD